MVRKIISIIIIVTIGSLHGSFAQDSENKENKKADHLYLNNGKSVYGDNILINPPEAQKLRGCNVFTILAENQMRFYYKDTVYDLFVYTDNYVKVNDKLYNFSDVRFIMMDSVYIAVVEDIAKSSDIKLAPQIIDGKINLFAIKHETTETAPSNHYFYNRGKQKPKELRYKNIKHEFKEDSESMKYLEKHRKYQYIQAGVGIFTLTYLGINGIKYSKFLIYDDIGEDKLDQII
ncbi:MAG: hypothetical protein ACOCPM_04390, partial [Bacteroidales bacterium]